MTLLDCHTNQLTELDASSNTTLANLECGNNQLTELNLIDNVALEPLDCSDNHLAELLTNSYQGLRYVRVSPQTITLPLIKKRGCLDSGFERAYSPG